MTDLDDPLWTVVALALIILAGLGAHIYKKPSCTIQRRDRQERKAGDIDATALMQTAQSGGMDSLDYKKQTGDQPNNGGTAEQEIVRAIEPIEWWTGVLAVATTLGAIFALFTLGAIRGQLDEMRADRRPWVSLDAIIGGPYDIAQHTIAIDFPMKNYGRTPAIDLALNEKVFVLGDGFDAVAEKDKLCQPPRFSPGTPTIATTVFPTQVYIS